MNGFFCLMHLLIEILAENFEEFQFELEFPGNSLALVGECCSD